MDPLSDPVNCPVLQQQRSRSVVESPETLSRKSSKISGTGDRHGAVECDDLGIDALSGPERDTHFPPWVMTSVSEAEVVSAIRRS